MKSLQSAALCFVPAGAAASTLATLATGYSASYTGYRYRASCAVLNKPVAKLQRLNLGVQSAFMSRRFILMDQSFARHAVEHRNGCFVRILRRCFVTCFYRIDNLFHVGAHHRAHSGVSDSVSFSLPSPLFGLGGVCQLVLLEENVIQNSPVSFADYSLSIKTTPIRHIPHTACPQINPIPPPETRFG